MIAPILDEKNLFEKISSLQNPFHKEYYAFYSSWYGGIVKNPQLMLLPIDDHIVHRGDGVFETMKAVARAVYLMDEHLHRLFRSSKSIALQASLDYDQLKAIILETLIVADQEDAIIRIYLSRGPGNFSVNPYDAIGPQLYVVIAQLIPPTPEKYERGVTVGESTIPIKPTWMAQIKSCNYLPNVLMKKEAVDRGMDFVIGVDHQGHITESATENIMIVDQKGTIVHPTLDSILSGTTMVRACELAREHGLATEVRAISLAELHDANEVMIAGTSLNILPVVAFEGDPIASGQPGPVAKQLNEWMLHDIAKGEHSTRF
jgi:4-amino-4-deoxychorismate lyase